MSRLDTKRSYVFRGSLFLGGCLIAFYLGRSTAPDGSEYREEAKESQIFDPVMEEPKSHFSVSKERGEERARKGETEERVGVLSGKFGRPLSRRDLWLQMEEVRNFAMSSPERALQLIAEQAGPVAAGELRAAVFETWGRQDLRGALRAALRFEGRDSREAVLAVCRGGGEDAAELVAVVDWMAQLGGVEKEGLEDFGGAVLEGLMFNGHFEEALRFAEKGASRWEGPSAMRKLFAEWGRWEPEGALVAAIELDGEAGGSEAFEAGVGSWARADPASLAEFGEALEEGEVREALLAKALASWVSKEPDEASEWLSGRVPAPEFDDGVLALVHRPGFAESSPREAIAWAERLSDKGMRDRTLARVLMQWAATDRAAAVDYIGATRRLSAKRQMELLALFEEGVAFGID